LHRVSQLSGFAKTPNFAYFLAHLIGARYRALPSLAPTAEMLATQRYSPQARCATMPSEYVWKTSFLPQTMLARPIEDIENPSEDRA